MFLTQFKLENTCELSVEGYLRLPWAYNCIAVMPKSQCVNVPIMILTQCMSLLVCTLNHLCENRLDVYNE